MYDISPLQGSSSFSKYRVDYSTPSLNLIPPYRSTTSSATMTDTNLKTYRGNCHCGAFVYEAELPEIKTLQACNCSICHKKGYAWVFPGEDKMRIVKGSLDELTAYTFNSAAFTHRFCPTCGTGVIADNSKMPKGMAIGVNARAIQGLDIWSLEAGEPYDGKALPAPYEAPVYTGSEPSVTVENGKIYHGSCHCGAVTMALKVKPLEIYDISNEKERIIECNCSICMRGGYVWVYPHKDQSVIQGEENLTYYVFNSKATHKAFCKHCGVHIFNEMRSLTDEEVEALSDAFKARRARGINNRNINLRILNDFDCSTLKTRRLDGFGMISGAYVNP